MSEKYVGVGWNRQKKLYDATIVAALVLYLALFIAGGGILEPNATAETLVIRAFGTAAFAMLHVVLLIGPLCRLSPKFLPLLYNRRHLGVATFLVGAVHGVFSIVQFHAFGDLNPLVGVLTSNTRFGSVADFPFQILGLAALVVLFLMAATSHDFWLRNLTPTAWKSLHMSVYAAYAMLVAHVALGVLQAETSSVLAAALSVGVALVVVAHLLAAARETATDKRTTGGAEFVDACAFDDVPDQRACVRTIAGERVAIFRNGDSVSAISNLCRHQNGPLGEGRIIDGCVTCPWHGFQYLPETGASPPPFTEKVETYDVRIENGRVLVANKPNAPGTRVEPAKIAR